MKGCSFTSYLRPARAHAKAAADEEEDEEDEEADDDDDFDDDLYAKYANNAGYASYEYYEAAAEEEVPGYRVELAKSGRSKCVKCKDLVEKGAVRIGSLDEYAGSYGRWNHLGCWRVPVKVQ